MGHNRSDGLSTGERVETRGDTATILTSKARRSVWIELFVLWIAVLLTIRLLVWIHKNLGVHEIVLGLVPLLFIYAPVWLSNWRKVDSYSYRLSIPPFRDWIGWWSAVKLSLIFNLSVWIWFVPLYVWYYQSGIEMFGWQTHEFTGALPKELLLIVLYQLFYVAIPEEFFYRGYFQTRLNELYERKWKVFGIQIGMGAIYSNLFFAFGHSLVHFQWWHFATFFPGVLFSMAREKSNGVLSGAIFHACCNIGIILLDTSYGLRPPV